MAKYTFFNIGKANAEIDRLNGELSAAKTSNPGDAQKLADVLASNEEISKLHQAAVTDLEASRQSISKLTSQLETAQSEVNTIGGAVKTACTALKVAFPATASTTEMISIMQTSIPSIAATKAQEITAAAGAPPAPAIPAAAADNKPKSGMSRIIAAAKADLATAGYAKKND